MANPQGLKAATTPSEYGHPSASSTAQLLIRCGRAGAGFILLSS